MTVGLSLNKIDLKMFKISSFLTLFTLLYCVFGIVKHVKAVQSTNPAMRELSKSFYNLF